MPLQDLMSDFPSNKPLDTEGDFRALMKDFAPVGGTVPMVSSETVEDVTKKPVGRPEGAAEAPTPEPQAEDSVLPGLTRNQQVGQRAAEALGLSPYVTGGYQEPEPYVSPAEEEVVPEISMEASQNYREWYKEEGLPAAGAILGSLTAPVTGGAGFWAALGASAAGAGLGGFTGEAAEQLLKKEGVMSLAIDEEAPRNGWDVLDRAVVQGGKELALDALGGLFFRGLSHGASALIKKTAKPRVLKDGTVLNQQKEDLVNTVRKWAEANGVYEGEAILASQIADVAHYNFLEDVAKASYIGSEEVEKVLAKQEEVIIGEAKELAGQLLTAPKATVAEAEGFLGNYFKANMEHNNDFVVAGLVRKTFTDAQNQRKSVARSIYNTMDVLANQTSVKQIMEEVPTGFFRPDGQPIMTLRPVTREFNRFTVKTQEVREWAADKLDESILKADPILGELSGLPMESSMKQSGEALAELKGRSRTLKDQIQSGTAAEDAPRRKLLLDEAISRLESAYSDTIALADEAGIVAPDGRTLGQLKEEADGIWAQQVEDFQNRAIVKILENTDLTNGSPDELVTQFLKSPAHAEKILNALQVAKDNLQGEALDHAFRTEQMIKGTIVERVLLPVDALKKTYMLPDVKLLQRHSATIKQLLGEDTFEAVRRLASASEQHSATVRSSTMAYAQKAREAGMTLQGIQGALERDPSMIQRVSSTLIVALNAGKILTKPRNLKFAEALDDPTVSPAYKRRAFRFLMEEWVHYMQAQEDVLSDEKRKHLKDLEALRKEDLEMSKAAQ